VYAAEETYFVTHFLVWHNG